MAGAKKRKYTQLEIAAMFEQRKQLLSANMLEQIMALMDRGMTSIAYLAARRRLLRNRFIPEDLRKSIDTIITTFHADTSNVIVNGIARARKLADQKVEMITESYFGGGQEPPSKKVISAAAGGRGRKPPGTPINPAAGKFGSHFNARQLSPRVWKLANSFKATINKTLVAEMKKGTPAREIAKQLRSSLRNSQGSETPGQGVYKSPMKNALRLTRTETNLAYEFQDYERWQSLWFVVGIEVKLSARHPVFDICDSLVGKYPKDFMFPGWHSQCLCIAIPVMASAEARDKMLDYQLGNSKEKPSVEYIKTLPDSANTWLTKNSERMSNWKSQPYFMQYNAKYIAATK